MAGDRWRRLSGAVGNAFVFAVGWSVGAFLLWLPLRQAGVLPQIQIIDGIGIAIRFGVVGFITGFIFPTLMRLLYRGHRVQEISWWKFGLAGALIVGVFIPTFMQGLNILSGDGPVAFSLIRMDIVWTGVLGGLATRVAPCGTALAK